MRPFVRGFAVFAMLTTFAACRVVQHPPAAPAPSTASGAKKTATATSCDNLVAPPDSQFPANFDYPQSSATVQGWVQSRDGHRERVHAYCLFAGLNQPAQGSSVPVWRTWLTSTQAFPNQYNPWPPQAAAKGSEGPQPARTVPINEARSRAAGKLGAIVNTPPTYLVNNAVATNPSYTPCLQSVVDKNSGTLLGYTLKDGQVFQSNGDIMVAAVSYNQAALQNILNTTLYNAVTLNGQLPGQATSPSNSVTPFPADSIVLKVMLWPVNGGGTTWTAVTALPIWDWDANKPGSPSDGQYAGYEMQQFWTNAVAISSGPVTQSGGVQRVQFLYGVLDQNGKPLGPNTYDGQLVGLDRFYSRKYSDADLAALSPCDRAILDASAYWSYNRAFQAGDSLAMVAMHIMTKEQSDWTFQSAWWHPDARDCAVNTRFCGHRPASVPGGDTTWKNYMMTTTYGMQQQSGNPNFYAPPDTQNPPQVWPVAYNPYIELAASHPITTNCMNCHHRAAWPPNVDLFQDSKPDLGRFSAYLQSSPANPNPLEVFTPDNNVFDGLLMVDSMWAVSDRAGYPAPATRAAEKPAKENVVELDGIEPTTSSLRTRRSPN